MEAAGVGRMPTLSDHMSDGRRRGKDLAGIGMLVLFAAGMAGVVLTWLLSRYASLVPDPAIGDGDPCCSYPDDWRDVGSALAVAIVSAVVTASLLGAAFALGWWSLDRGWPSWRRLLILPAIAVALTVASVALAHLRAR